MPVSITVSVESSAGIDGAGDVVERAARTVAADQDVEAGELSLTLLDDAGMAALNRKWLDRSGPTDVLAFELEGPEGAPVGDIYVGAERAVEQAEEAGEPVLLELARLAVHGTLHALGWDHPEVDRESSPMWREQERILALVELP